jgi:hypothetical protein
LAAKTSPVPLLKRAVSVKVPGLQLTLKDTLDQHGPPVERSTTENQQQQTCHDCLVKMHPRFVEERDLEAALLENSAEIVDKIQKSIIHHLKSGSKEAGR